MRAEPPIFLIGWFRSGTTMFWNLLRESGRYTCFYEPLHEHLELYLEKDWDWVDSTHSDVSDYWREYRLLSQATFGQCWRPSFGRSRWVLDANDEAPELNAYIDLLIDQAEKRPVLKFVRAGVRAEWLRHNYPDAYIVHIVRNPRAVWSSMMGRECMADSYDDELSDRSRAWFRRVRQVSDELGIGEQAHPYQRFYVLWKQMFLTVAGVADTTWWYDDAVEGGEDWVESHLVDSGLLSESPSVNILQRSLHPTIHSSGWYYEQELTVEKEALRRQPWRGGKMDVRVVDNDVEAQRQENRYEALSIDYVKLSENHLCLIERRCLTDLRTIEKRCLEMGRYHVVLMSKVLKLILKVLDRIFRWSW